MKWYKKLFGKTFLTNNNPNNILMDGKLKISIQRCLPKRFLKNLPERLLKKNNSEVKRKYYIENECSSKVETKMKDRKP